MRKKIFTTGFFALLFTALSAQVSLDKTYTYSTAVVKLETLGYKYFLMDVPNEQCRIYNLDHSLFKTITCKVPTDFYLADIKYVSQNLFDNDSGIELVFTFYKYVPTTTSYYYMYNSKIINEEGTVIQNIDGARYIYINQTGENTNKLFAYCYDYSVFPEIIWTNIYNLPGMPVVSSAIKNDAPEIGIGAFPNPASKTVTVAYKLPEPVSEGTLHLFDNTGRKISQFTIDPHSDHLSLDVSQYQRGVYHYFVEYGNTKMPSGKLVIQ
jgi:hypothetical protein